MEPSAAPCSTIVPSCARRAVTWRSHLGAVVEQGQVGAEAPDAPVAVVERMQRHELIVGERRSDHRRQGRMGRIHPVDPGTQSGFEGGARQWRNEPCVSNSP
jgi:hypothetical protein